MDGAGRESDTVGLMIRKHVAMAGLAWLLGSPLATAHAQGAGQRMLELAGQPATEQDRARARAALPADGQRQLEYVHPSDADPRVSEFLQDHVVITRAGARANGKLLVFLPGTRGRPVGYEKLLDTAARMGYRAIGLEYVDAVMGGGPSTIIRLCGRTADPNCAGSLRAARAFGGQGEDGNTVPVPDGIVPRLVSLLKYLDRTHGGAGWGAFYHGDTPEWSRIVLAGHSEGAGMAAFLARKNAVAGVALISGGPDGNPMTRQVAAWVAAPSATPAARWFAMADAGEPLEEAMMAGFAALGVAGPPTPWTGAGGMGRSHTVVVDLEPRAGGKHESTATDLATPLASDGGAAYAPVWQFLLQGGAAGSG